VTQTQSLNTKLPKGSDCLPYPLIRGIDEVSATDYSVYSFHTSKLPGMIQGINHATVGRSSSSVNLCKMLLENSIANAYS